MGFTLRERRRQAGDLRVIVRDDAKVPGEKSGEPESPESPASVDGISGPGSPDSPDSPSPRASTFPPPLPPAQTSITSTSSIQSVVDPTNTLPPATTQSSVTTQPAVEPVATALPDTTIPEPSTTTTFSTSVIPALAQTAAPLTSTLALPQSSTTDRLVAEPTENSQNGQAQVAQSSGGGDISQPSQIGLGTSGAAVFLGIIFFIFWKFRRGRTQSSSSNKNIFSRLLPSRPKKDPQEDVRPLNATNRPPDARTQSNIMDELMAAAYAAEDGQNTFGNPQQQQLDIHADEKQQSDPRAYLQTKALPLPLPLPLNARMPPPRAPSVAAQTEMTSGTETTWRTWGVSQEKKPTGSWLDKYVRNGGIK
ncbi:hypothetical protein F5X99DRAFT_15195 [Biscogniauxia marginata]|nr:hypothetical protein F5X99DRAFT_15195 [Biscogniauxia marginata]